VSEARLFHEDVLMTDGVEKLADSSINPPEKWVYHVHDLWRKQTFGDATSTPSFLRCVVDISLIYAVLGNLQPYCST